MQRNIKFATVLTAIAFSALIQSCDKALPKTAEAAPAKKAAFCVSDSLAKMIKIEDVKTENIQDALNLSGEVSYNDDKVVRVMPLVSGQVLQVKVSLGDRVQAGQTLAVMRSFEVANSSSDARTATVDVDIYQKNMDKAESMYKIGMISERDYQQSKQDYQKALAILDKTQNVSNLYGGGGVNGEVIIKAPTSGYILEKKVSAGSTVRNDNADNLFTIGNLNEVWVLANVFESDVARVREGYEAKVKVLAYPDKTFTGKIDKVSSVLDPNNKVMKVRIRLPNDAGLLKPQMFTNVIITNIESTKALTVPATAVIFQGGKNHVIIYKDKCDLQVGEVNIIKTVGDKTYISSGVQLGDKLVTLHQGLIYSALTSAQ